MGLAEVLQICCLGRRNGQITFRAWDNEGFVFVQHGQVLHAATGAIEGEEAIYQMLTWTNGAYTFEDDILPQRRTVQMTWEQLLFEGARRADEGIAAPPPHPRGPGNMGTPISSPISSRLQGSQPKLIITVPGMAPFNHDLVNEFTHVGRVEGNEIVIPIPSVSSRHCIFIFSGTDIVIRDLNSANGTLVNDELVMEKILQLGDSVKVGEAEIRFESGIKRPKLRESTPEPTPEEQPPQPNKGITRPKITETAKQPDPPKPVDNNQFLSGGAIRIDTLTAAPKQPVPTTLYIVIGIVVVVLLLFVGFYFYAKSHGIIK
jgi:hypothetical protein